MNPLISVIIPAFNAASTIQETLRSVLNQTYEKLEVIVIEDGSQDNTAEVVEHLSDERVQVFKVPNGGPAASRNRGFARSRGEYVSFLDADDLWTHDKVQDQLNLLQERPRAGVAYSWTDYIDEQGEPLFAGCHRSDEGDVYSLMLVSDFLENGSNALLRREVAETLSGFNERVPRGSEDWEYFIRAARITEFACVPKAQVFYRLSKASLSSDIEAQLSRLLSMIDTVYAQAPFEMRSLRKRTEAHIHMYLAQKALDSEVMGRSALCLRLLLKGVLLQPSLLLDPQRISTTLVKAAATGILPADMLTGFLRQLRRRRWGRVRFES